MKWTKCATTRGKFAGMCGSGSFHVCCAKGSEADQPQVIDNTGSNQDPDEDTNDPEVSTESVTTVLEEVWTHTCMHCFCTLARFFLGGGDYKASINTCTNSNHDINSFSVSSFANSRTASLLKDPLFWQPTLFATCNQPSMCQRYCVSFYVSIERLG